jgi:hypothetical protein
VKFGGGRVDGFVEIEKPQLGWLGLDVVYEKIPTLDYKGGFGLSLPKNRPKSEMINFVIACN